MNKLYILYGTCFIIILITSIILIYSFKKSKKSDDKSDDKSGDKSNKSRINDFVFNNMKNNMSHDYPYNLSPDNLYMLDENVKSISDCMTNIILKRLEKNNIDVEKYINNDLTPDERQNFENSSSDYPEENKKCYADNQLTSIKSLAIKAISEQSGNQTKSDIENIITYIKSNMKIR